MLSLPLYFPIWFECICLYIDILRLFCYLCLHLVWFVFLLAYCPVSNIPATLYGWNIYSAVASYLLNSGAFNSIADAEIYPGRDICKILHSCHCVRITVLNLQVLKVYAYKPVKNFAFKNHSLNSFTFVRTFIYKTVQISACRTSIQPCIKTKKECRLIPFGFNSTFF